MNSAFSAAMSFSELKYPSPMLILTEPEFYYTFSKYYLCISSTASLLAITGFRQLNPIHCFENIPLLSTQSGNQRKQHEKRGRGEGGRMPGALEYDLGRADEPEEGQIQTKGQKNSSVKMGCKPAFQPSFLCK